MDMDFYWSTKAIPELKSLESQERSRLWRAGYDRCLKGRLFWATWISFLAFCFICSVGSRMIADDTVTRIVLGCIGFGLGGIIVWQVVFHCTRQHIAAILAEESGAP